MVAAMKPGSVIMDLAAEKGGNCKLTVADEKVVTDNGVTIIGYTDFPSRMAAQSSTLYSTNIRHMMTDLTPEKDGQLVHNMEDDVIRSSMRLEGEVTYPPPPLKVQAIASKAAPKQPEKTPEEKAAEDAAAMAKSGRQQTQLLIVGAALMGLIGLYAPTAFMQHFIVFVLAVFVGFPSDMGGCSHSLHTPLMAVTNAISGIIIVGALLQVDSDIPIVSILAGISVLIATINIVGGFMVTRRMLQMFKKS